MGLKIGSGSSESRFNAYVEAITSALGHADRAAPFRSYCTGLLLPGDRKSVEPMAARVEPARVQAAHQSLHHFVAKAEWSDDAVLAAVRELVLQSSHGRVRSVPLSLMTPACQRRANIPSAWRSNIAGNSANKTIAQWR